MLSCRLLRPTLALFAGFVLGSLSLVASAQTDQMPRIQFHPQKAEREGPAPDKFEIYAGYGYIHPVNSDINNYQYQPVYNLNATASLTGYFTRHIGLQIEGGYFNGPNSDVIAAQCAINHLSCLYRDPKYYTGEAGPVFRWQIGRFVPYIHTLGGAARIGGPVFQPLHWGWATTGGVGMDYILPLWHDRIAIRPIQADFHYSQVDNGPLVLPAGVTGGFGEIYAYKLSGGLVARFGKMESAPQAVMLACPVSPAAIYPGDPVSVLAQPLNLLPGHQATYTWTTTGGKLTAGEGGANIDTAGLPPGDYVVTGHVTQGRKAMQTANCQGNFTVRPYDPPTIGCTATPSTVQPGGSSTIAANGFSPQNRQLTYTYTSSAGQIAGAGSTATLSTAGAPPGTINITCSLSDDLGKTATASTTVTVTAPPPQAVLPQTQTLCSVSFERDRRRPVRVDNEAKACLDDVALNLNHDPAARLVVVGRYSADEGQIQGEERSVNVRSYLLGKGVDGARIELRVGDGSGRAVDNVMLPTGALYTDVATTFDPSTVHPPVYAAPQRSYRGTTRHRQVTRHRRTRKK